MFNTIVPPGVVPFFEQLHEAGFTERGGQLVCTYFDENCLGLVPAEQVEGLYGCLDYYQACDDPFSNELLVGTTSSIRAAPCSRAAARAQACTGG